MIQTTIGCVRPVVAYLTITYGIFLQSVPVKELLKSVNIWRIYGQKFYGGTFCMTHDHGVFPLDTSDSACAVKNAV